LRNPLFSILEQQEKRRCYSCKGKLRTLKSCFRCEEPTLIECTNCFDLTSDMTHETCEMHKSIFDERLD